MANPVRVTGIYNMKRHDPVNGTDALMDIRVNSETAQALIDIIKDNNCRVHMFVEYNKHKLSLISGYFADCYKGLIPSLILHGFDYKIHSRGFFARWMEMDGPNDIEQMIEVLASHVVLR